LFDEIVMVTTTLDISERKRIENEMTYRAFHDPLTGLPNRALLMERVDALLDAADEASPFALAFINLDDFKQVNECYSHAIGDQVLIAVAGRIQKYMRESDILARMNGDEFMLLASPLKGAEELTPLMDSLANAIRRPFEIEGHPLMISASIGVSLYPNHGQNYEALLRAADSAMYLAKKSNRGGVSYFDPKMAEAVAARMALEQRLRTAIHAGHFRAALQPKVLLDSGKIMGFEALVRWVQPDGKVNMPGMFIQLATDLCLIDDITRLVMKDILQALPSLRSQFGNDISVSINIGARQAGDTEFMKSLVEQIERSGEAGYLVVEITEDAFLATQCFQQQVLPELRRIGVTVSIDDFGTGYSSLSMLADVTADEVKVDRAFITSIQDRPRSQGILKAIESLCTALDIAMVAEGIETKEELAYLHENTSIAQAQGYFFGKPAFLEHWVPEPIDDVLDLDWGLPPPASFSGTLKVLSS
jgi:diguanylate cyclase (GGDEF)-like protein